MGHRELVGVRAEKNALVVGDSTYDKVWYEFRGTGTEKAAGTII